MTDQREIAGILRRGLSDSGFASMIHDERAPETLDQTFGGMVHPDFETAMVSGGGGLRTEYRGTDGFVAAWRDWLKPFESFRIVIDEDLVGSGDIILSFARQTGVLPGGAELSEDAAAVLFFRDGLLARVEFHVDRDEAMRAAGLA